MAWLGCFGLSKNRMENRISNYKKLSEYTDFELKEFLDKNEEIDAQTLSFICSEVLRRIINHD